MSKVSQYLQQHLVGEVMDSPDAREYFATDASILKLKPQIIVYPRVENDIRKAARFTWQLAERGRAIPLTARGLGSDLAGAAIGSGILLVFPAHMNRIITLDSNKGYVVVEPGLNFGHLQQTLQTHGYFLPSYPASIEYSTIGGAIANNAAGEKSVKYGSTKDYVRELRVVLANGEVITTARYSKKEINKKMGLATFEGEIYRALDALINENQHIIENSQLDVSKNNAGYDIWNIRYKDGSVDLSPLIVGSQGTLGIITEATIDVEAYNPKTTLLVGYFNDLDSLVSAISQIKKYNPSVVELVDENLLAFLESHNPNQLKNIIPKPFPKAVLMIEFDDSAGRQHKKRVKKTRKILEKLASDYVLATDDNEQEDLWKIRHSAAAVMWANMGSKKALPVLDDGVVPVDRLAELINNVYELFKKQGLHIAIWGHAGDGNIHIQPFFDLAQTGDRQKIFRLMDEYYKMIISMGGSTTGEYNDGRLRAPYLGRVYGDEVYEIFRKIKNLFDPYNTLNPGVKIDVTPQDIQPLLRQDYTLGHFYSHMPRT